MNKLGQTSNGKFDINHERLEGAEDRCFRAMDVGKIAQNTTYSKKDDCKFNQIKLKHSLETLITTIKLKYFGYITRTSHSIEKA